MGGRTGDDQIPYSGKTGKGIPVCTHGNAQSGHFRQAPGHEHGFDIVTVAHTVGHAGTQGNHVFQCTAQFRTHDIRAGIDAEIVRHERILHQFRMGLLRACRHTAGGHALGQFFRMAGAGQSHHRTVRLLLYHLAHAKQSAFFNALSHWHHNRIFVQICRDLTAHLPNCMGRTGNHHQRTPRHTRRLSRYFQFLRQGDPIQAGVMPGILHLLCLFGRPGHQSHIMAIFAQGDGQCRAPGTASNNCNSHLFKSL